MRSTRHPLHKAHSLTHLIVAAAHVRGLDLATLAQIIAFQIGN